MCLRSFGHTRVGSDELWLRGLPDLSSRRETRSRRRRQLRWVCGRVLSACSSRELTLLLTWGFEISGRIPLGNESGIEESNWRW